MKRAVRKAGFVEQRFEHDGVFINHVVGPNNGPPLVLFPGQTIPWESYELVLPELSKLFQVFAVDVHGHGKSSWTPGRYTFDAMGRDMAALLEQVVGRPAIVSGNSSGGIIATWLAAFASEWVLAVVPEDPPLFSSEWPRLRDDCFVHSVFQRCVEMGAEPEQRKVAAFFDGLEVPRAEGQTPLKLPKMFGYVISAYIRGYRLFHREGPIDLALLPHEFRVWVKGFSEWDIEFTRAFLDGSAVEGFDHAEMLKQVRCPMLLLHANWFRTEDFGLVGAMDDEDVKRIRALVRDFRYERIDAGHLIHIDKPKLFIRQIVGFAQELGAISA